jgi:RNA methyltransferase, TrmH family
MPKANSKVLHQLQSRHGRRKSAVFLCEGLRCCAEAAARRPVWIEFAVVAESCPDAAAWLGKAQPWPAYPVTDAEFAAYAQTETPQGILVVLRRPEDTPPAALADPFVVVLDRLQNPGNLGTILRTALAVGLTQVAYTRGTVDPYCPKSIRAGMGAQFGLRLAAHADLAAARACYGPLGYARLWLTVVADGINCFSPEFTLAGSLLVLGNEANGVAELAAASRVTIPMAPGVESLNVAQAATVLMYQHLARQISTGGDR